MNTTEWEELRAFRHHVYTLFGCRRDALFEALDAVLSAPPLEAPAHLSLAPLWFWWHGPTPPDLAEVWQAYIARFSLEHTFRFFKQTLRWTTPRLHSPDAADRWTWLLILASVHLLLARDAIAEVRLPWLPPERRTPAHVRRGFSHLLPHLGSRGNSPKPCGRSPGRPNGKRSPSAKRFPAVKLTS